MNSLYEILKALEAIKGKNAKIEFLKIQGDNVLLKRVLFLAYSGTIVFGIKKIPVVKGYYSELSFEQALAEIEAIVSLPITGGKATAALAYALEGTDIESANVIERIIGKDLKCGIGKGTINKAFKDLVPDTPYMGAVPYSAKRIKQLFSNYSEVYCQVKADGRYANIVVADGEIRLESRQGKPTHLDGLFRGLVTKGNFVYNGELVIPNILRYESNGIISAISSVGGKESAGKDVAKEKAKFAKKHGKSYKEWKSEISFICWDVITYAQYLQACSSDPYKERVSSAERLIKGVANISMVSGIICNDARCAQDYYASVLSEGEEGLVCKGDTAPWRDGKPTFQVKMKLKMQVDLKIIGFNEGTKGTKLEGSLGSLVCSSSCGFLVTYPSGITDLERQYIYDHQEEYLGKIAVIESCGVSRNSAGEYALLHPVYIETREDKDVADDLAQILEIEVGMVAKAYPGKWGKLV